MEQTCPFNLVCTSMGNHLSLDSSPCVFGVNFCTMSTSAWCTACPEEFSGFLMIGYRHRSLRQSSVQLAHFQICFLAVPSYFSGGTSTSIAWFKPWEAPPNRAMWAIVVSMPHQEARKFPNTWGHDWNWMVPKVNPISPWFLGQPSIDHSLYDTCIVILPPSGGTPAGILSSNNWQCLSSKKTSHFTC